MTGIDRKPPFNAGTSVLGIGDTHWWEPLNPWAKGVVGCAADVNGMVGRVDVTVQLGDHTHNGHPAEFANHLGWRAGVRPGVPFFEVMGNHEGIGCFPSGTPDLVTPEQWAEIVGAPAPSRYVDVKDVRLVLLAPTSSPAEHQWRLTIDADQADWLDGVLDTTQKCVIAFHAPLPGTVGPLDGSAFSSFDERWVMHDDPSAPVLDVIAGHSSVVAWMAGHTHSSWTEANAVYPMSVGAASFVHVACGSPAFRMPTNRVSTSVLLTVDEGHVDVRIRDHTARQWRAGGQRIHVGP
jgi:hypothetical protein